MMVTNEAPMRSTEIVAGARVVRSDGDYTATGTVMALHGEVALIRWDMGWTTQLHVSRLRLATDADRPPQFAVGDQVEIVVGLTEWEGHTGEVVYVGERYDVLVRIHGTFEDVAYDEWELQKYGGADGEG